MLALGTHWDCLSSDYHRLDSSRFGSWGARALGGEFIARIQAFRPDRVNILPLLHRSVSGGKFLQSHSYFCNDPDGNHFDFIGVRIATLLLAYSGPQSP